MASTHDSKTCQVCGEQFATITDKAVHASTAHDLRRTGGKDRTRGFIACQCNARVFIGDTCPNCGTVAEIPSWATSRRHPRG